VGGFSIEVKVFPKIQRGAQKRISRKEKKKRRREEKRREK